MYRYAVKIVTLAGDVQYESIGKGTSADPQDAHLYTREKLAVDKMCQYLYQPNYYRSAEVITVEVTGLY